MSIEDDEDDVQQPSASTVLTIQQTIPPYGQRKGWRPTKPEDFGDGGAYPECHIAQYPLELGKKKVRLGSECSPTLINSLRLLLATLSPFKLIVKVTSDTMPSHYKVNEKGSLYSLNSRTSFL